MFGHQPILVPDRLFDHDHVASKAAPFSQELLDLSQLHL